MLEKPVFSIPLDSAYVGASSHRTLVLATLSDWPKTTGQVALACSLSLSHASRAIHDLVERNLATCLNPDLKGRGRLYAASKLGEEVSRFIAWQGTRPPTVPLVKATHPRAWLEVLVRRYGTREALDTLRIAGCISVVEAPEGQWLPLRSQMRLLDLVESRFGDGSFHLIRELAAEAVPHYSSLKKILMRALPLQLLLELSPTAYLREFNHGRVEIDCSRSEAKYRNYDWLSSPARCAAWLGSYEGALTWMGIPASVEKRECILSDDEFCGYEISWTG